MSDQTPTDELAAHHDIIPARRGQPAAIQSRVDALLVSGAIDEAEHAACKRWHRDWDLGMEGASPGGLRVRVDADNGGSALDRRIDAMSRLRRVQADVTGLEWIILTGCIANDLSWPRLATVLGVHHKTAKKWAIEAIHKLTSVYALIDAAKPRRVAA